MGRWPKHVAMPRLWRDAGDEGSGPCRADRPQCSFNLIQVQVQGKLRGFKRRVMQPSRVLSLACQGICRWPAGIPLQTGTMAGSSVPSGDTVASMNMGSVAGASPLVLGIMGGSSTLGRVALLPDA